MAVTLNASNSGTGGLSVTSDATGNLAFQTAGNTAIAVDTSQNATFAGTASAAKLIPTGSSVTGNGMYLPAANSLGLSTNGTNAVYINSSQNVGVGTASPTQKLQVAGNVFVSAGQYFMWDNAGAWSWQSDASTYLRAYYNGNEAMRINSSGNVGIGTSSPSVRLHVSGSGIVSDTLQVFNNPTSSAQGILFRNTFNTGGSIFSTGSATTNDFVLWVGGSGTQGGITGNGAGINYSSASDYRLKQNIAPMTGALAKVALLKPCTYTWKFDGSDGQGFIAHELDEVFPDAVTGEKDAVETYTDEDGNEQTRIKPQGVDTSFLVATLTAAIQEQQAIIADLKARIEALEA